MIYVYRIFLGKATLLKLKRSGEDVDEKPKQIGSFRTYEAAEKACRKHFDKACRMADAAGRTRPEIRFI